MDPLAFLNTVSSVRAGLTPTASITAQTNLLPNNINIGGSLSVAGEVTNNVTGALSLRAYDDTGLYAATTLTIGNPLPAPLTTKPILEQQITSLNLAGATFGTISSGYSLKINGYVQPPATGTYLFRTTYRDGASLVIATRKLLDSWLYAGTLQQSVGTITLYQNVWSQFAMEHTVTLNGSEKLLVEWCNPGGTYTTLQNGSFTFAYDMKEVPSSFLGTTYVFGKANFSDMAVMTAGANLPNATYFSGNTSELANDAAFLKSNGTFTGLITTGVGSISTLAASTILTASASITGPLTFGGAAYSSNSWAQWNGTVSAGANTAVTATQYSTIITSVSGAPCTISSGTLSFVASGLYHVTLQLSDATFSGTTMIVQLNDTTSSTTIMSARVQFYGVTGGEVYINSSHSYVLAYIAGSSSTLSVGYTTTIRASNLRVGLLSNSTLTSPNTTLPGNISVAGSLTAPIILGTNLAIAGTATAAAIQLSGTTAGTYLLFNNNVSTVSGTLTTTAYGAFGISPGTALDRFALNAHRWWTGSSGTSSGTVGMLLNSAGLTLATLSVNSMTTTYLTAAGTCLFSSIVRSPNNLYTVCYVNPSNSYSLSTSYNTTVVFPQLATLSFLSNSYSNGVALMTNSNTQIVVPFSGFWEFRFSLTMNNGPNTPGNGYINTFTSQCSNPAMYDNQAFIPGQNSYAYSFSTSGILLQGDTIQFSLFNYYGSLQVVPYNFRASLLQRM